MNLILLKEKTYLKELKPKFIRFGIDIKKSIEKYDDTIMYDILKKNSDNIYSLNDKLIIEHELEIDNKMKQIDNEFIKLSMNFNDDYYKIISSKNKIIINSKK
jgi:hypothetical protein